MTFDFTKEYKELYVPKTKPALVEAPAMTFIAVAGEGDPNDENGAYAQAVGLLYALSYTIRMAKNGDWQPDGYFEYKVAPLEGLWWTASGGFDGRRITDKSKLQWVSLIRQPDFVTTETFAWAREKAAAKKPGLDTAQARLVRFAEGPCAQVLHRGPYDDEPATVAALSAFIADSHLKDDIADPENARALLAELDANGGVPGVRLHHEIYLSDPRRSKPENLRTVVRHPVRPASA